MNVALIQPNCAAEVDREHLSLQFPINLGGLAAVLKQHGHRVWLWDFNVTDRAALPALLDRHRPDVVGVTAMSSTVDNAGRIVEQVKAHSPGTVTMVGGVHATALPEQTPRDIPGLDLVVVGEGEHTLVELLDHLDDPAPVRGVAHRVADRIVVNPPRSLIADLDSLPPPDRTLVPMELYRKQHVSRGFSRRELGIIEIMTSRGCPYRCIFCAGHIAHGSEVRFRSLGHITAEIDDAVVAFGITHVSIEDDSFGLDRDLALGLCDYFRRNNITWNCNGHVNVLDAPLLTTMAASGCQKIAFGVESGSPTLLKKIRKGITVERVEKTVKAAKRVGVRYVECDFMIGAHPDESPEDIDATVGLIYRLMPDFLIVSIMCPYPGTAVYEMMKQRGFLTHPNWSQFSHFGDLDRYERITHYSGKEVFALQHKILRDYYTSPRYIARRLFSIRSRNEMKYFFRLGVGFVKEFFLKQHNRSGAAISGGGR